MSDRPALSDLPTALVWRLDAAAPPPLTDAYRVADLCRRAALGTAKRLFGPENLPFALHGHAAPDVPRPQHRHAFFLPVVAVAGGRIDHVLIHAPGGLDRASVAALNACERVFDGPGTDWPVRCTWLGPAELAPVPAAARATVWVSATPWLTTLHTRGPRRGLDALLARDLAHRGFPAPAAVTPCNGPVMDGRALERDNFLTALPRRGGEDRPRPAGPGTFWRITFAEPVQGPLALGWECHLGLGLFLPEGGWRQRYTASDGTG